MKKAMTWLVVIAGVVALAGNAGAQFETNTITETVNLDHLSGKFEDFKWSWNARNDQKVTLTLTNDSGGVTLTGTYGMFRMAKRTTDGGTTNVIDYGTGDVTIATRTMTIVVPRNTFTNIADGTYYAQVMWTDTAATNQARNVGRGTIRVTESLFDDD